MDTGDEAARREELDKCVALANARTLAGVLPEPNGSCLNCGDQVGDGLRWCDADCRDDWERLSAIARGRS